MLVIILSSCSGSAPVIRTLLCREVSPETSSTEDFDTPKSFARNSQQSLLAAPSTGGEVSLILSALSCIPQISFLDALGWTCRLIIIPSSV